METGRQNGMARRAGKTGWQDGLASRDCKPIAARLQAVNRPGWAVYLMVYTVFCRHRGPRQARLACLEQGIRVVDSAVSGTGGCPYAKGASGNVATEDVVYMLEGMGMQTGVQLELLINTGRWLSLLLGRETGSKVNRASIA